MRWITNIICQVWVGGEGPQNAKEVRLHLWLTWGQLKWRSAASNSSPRKRRSSFSHSLSKSSPIQVDGYSVNNTCRISQESLSASHDLWVELLGMIQSSAKCRPNCKGVTKKRRSQRSPLLPMLYFQHLYGTCVWYLAQNLTSSPSFIFFKHQKDRKLK